MSVLASDLVCVRVCVSPLFLVIFVSAKVGGVPSPGPGLPGQPGVSPAGRVPRQQVRLRLAAAAPGGGPSLGRAE